MLFNSIEYLFFLPVVFLLYWFLLKSRKGRNYFLIAASYAFYGWWNVKLLGLIFGVTLAAYLAGGFIGSPGRSRGMQRGALWLTILLNIGILVIFKYYNFFASGFSDILEALNFTPDIPTLDIILPVGISFYTFQAISYVIDVYRGSIRPCSRPDVFFVFIGFFPQLVAGPIERASNLIPQFEEPHPSLSYEQASSGMKLILWGLFKKMVVADNAAEGVNVIFGNWQDVGTVNLWIGAILFSFQIYGDFSGYSDLAIGSARLFGINLRKNFDLPYFSRDITEFWKRWHISLTSWFRDYLYIPLGGNRKGKGRTVANTIIIFLVSGLWHGANLTYVVWGAYHATLFVPYLIAGKSHPKRAEMKGRIPYFKDTLLMGVTFLLVAIGWVIFRAETLPIAFDYIRRMFSDFSPSTVIHGKFPLCLCALLVVTEWLSRYKETPFMVKTGRVWRHRAVRWTVYIATFILIQVFAGQSQDFIYFKF